MTTPEQYTYPRYLRSKRTVDDRALNRDVMEAVLAAMPTSRPVRIAELGGGVGTMVDRLIETERIAQSEYVIIDAEPTFLSEVAEMAPRWAKGSTRNGAHEGVSFTVSTRHARLEDWALEDGDRYDLIIAHAVLDLVDVPATLPRLLDRLESGGLFWPTINFDGDTIFMPKDPRDAALMDAYHASMDARDGSSTAGRELFEHIPRAGGEIVRAGASDWVVFGSPQGYIGDEAYFVHHILHTVEEELKTHPELGEDVLAWGRQRHAQVERGELVYVAHQLDFAVGRRHTSSR